MRHRTLLLLPIWALTALLLYTSMFGLASLMKPRLEFQVHETYIMFKPLFGLALLVLLLSPIIGAFYILLAQLPMRSIIWASGLVAMLLIFLIGGCIAQFNSPVPFRPRAYYADSVDGLRGQLVLSLQLLQVVLSGVMLLAGYALGRRGQPTKTPGSQR